MASIPKENEKEARVIHVDIHDNGKKLQVDLEGVPERYQSLTLDATQLTVITDLADQFSMQEQNQQVRVREPVPDSWQEPKGFTFVAFTKHDVIDCALSFIYGPGIDYVGCYLHLSNKSSSVDCYDLFNNIFKPKAFEMVGLHFRSPLIKKNMRDLTSEWKIKKTDFKGVSKEIRTTLGEKWGKLFSQIYKQIGKP